MLVNPWNVSLIDFTSVTPGVAGTGGGIDFDLSWLLLCQPPLH
jgi:hypothetical protein